MATKITSVEYTPIPLVALSNPAITEASINTNYISANITTGGILADSAGNFTSTISTQPVSAVVSITNVVGIYSPDEVKLNVNDTTNSEGVLGLYKGNSSIAIAMPSILKSVSRPLNSTNTTTNDTYVVKVIGKAATSTPTTTFILLKTVSSIRSSSSTAGSIKLLSFTKSPIQDTSIANSTGFRATSPLYSSSVTTTSAILSKEIAPTLNSSVYPTDDVLGGANIDDDQSAWVDKLVFSLNTVTSTPLLNAGLLKTSSSATVSTPLILSSILKASSSVANSDNYKTISTVTSSTTNTSSNIYSRDISKRADSSYTADSVILKALGIATSSSNSITSTPYKSLDVLRTSSGAVSETILKSASTLRSSSSTANFYISKAPGKLATDTGIVQEIKTAIVHNYFADLTYTQDITYVGSTYTI